MKQLKNTLLMVMVIMLSSCNSCKKGCTDSTASNYDSNAHKDDGSCIYKGSILFWEGTPACGYLTVTLVGQSSSYITNYYNTPPQNCVNLCGGYFNVPVGSYTYQVTSSNGCNIPGGTVTITKNSCSFQQLN